MTTTTMHMSRLRTRSDRAGTRPAGRAGRSLLDLSSLVAPALWMIAVAVIVVGSGALMLSRQGVPSGASATINVRVSPSDTLWTIAAANRLPGSTTAATVEAITRANGLRGSRIVSGSTLRVPVVQAPETAFAQADGATTDR